MKKILLTVLLLILIYFGYKGTDYYLENRLYANYVITTYWDGLSNKIDDGYTNKSSYFPGETQQVFIDGKEEEVTWLRLFDIENNVVDSIYTTISPQEKGPNPSENGFQYAATFSYTIPHLPSGVYTWENQIAFIIKGLEEEIVILYPTNTINAYNIKGGKSLYSIFSEQTHVVSFLRPTFPAISFQVKSGLEYFASMDHLPLRYIVDQDMDDFGEIDGAKLLIIIGHSEYWTRKARSNFDRLVDEGGNAVILSGNTMWWQIRYDDNKEKMICYKYLEDPIMEKRLSTTFWTNPLLSYPVMPSIGVDFPRGGFGRSYKGSFDGLKVVNSSSPLLAGTSLEKGDIIHLPTKEYDGSFLKAEDLHVRLDTDKLPFYKAELVAYDKAFLEEQGYGTFVIFQKTEASGVVINTATMDWCSEYGLGGKDSVRLKKITTNMIEGLWQEKPLFTY